MNSTETAEVGEETENEIGNAAATPARDEQYDLIAVLYHALKGADLYQTFIEDAENAGRTECTDFFQRCLEEDRARAQEAKRLLQMKVTTSPKEAKED